MSPQILRVLMVLSLGQTGTGNTTDLVTIDTVPAESVPAESVPAESVPTGFVEEQEKQLQPKELKRAVIDSMQRAATFFHQKVAVRGGYVYEYSPDLKLRKGEGIASPTEIWVQPPGTPTVGTAYLRAYLATEDSMYLMAALDAGRALVHGQLKSGGWTASIEFNPSGKNADAYRNGAGRVNGRNYSTLDDDKSQAAIRFLMSLDQALEFRNQQIHESVKIALDALLAAQFPNGGFPQGWKVPAEEKRVLKASYPDYDWKTEHRVRNYWDLYTLNDGLAGTVAETLIQAHETYGDERYLRSLTRLGEFLILAQMPEPQPIWAQQYSDNMHPAWARKFEPPAVASTESLDVMQSLLLIYEQTGDPRFLEPIPAAIAWFERSQLPAGGFARFYELRSNRPLYFIRDSYELTFDDSAVPTHYSFKNRIRIDRFKALFQEVAATKHRRKVEAGIAALSGDAARIVDSLDSEGRWITDVNGNPINEIRQDAAATPVDQQRILSRVFAGNLERLSEYLIVLRDAEHIPD